MPSKSLTRIFGHFSQVIDWSTDDDYSSCTRERKGNSKKMNSGKDASEKQVRVRVAVLSQEHYQPQGFAVSVEDGCRI